MPDLGDRRYWRIRRDIERLEGLVCFVMATVTRDYPGASVFWLILGALSIFHFWTWLARRRSA